MADFVFNIAKGRVTELANRVNLNDPANSAFLIAILSAGAATDATLRDYTTFAAIEADAAAAEATNTGYARKVLTDAGAPIVVTTDQTNDRVDIDIPDQTWTAVAAGSAWTDLYTGYDNDTTTGTDANVVPMTLHDFIVTPDGSDITAVIATAGFFRAS
jgi:hypothetical protein